MAGSLFVGICGYLWVFVVCGSRADGIVPQPQGALKRRRPGQEAQEQHSARSVRRSRMEAERRFEPRRSRRGTGASPLAARVPCPSCRTTSSWSGRLRRARQGKMTKASETEAVGATMPSDEAAEEAACEEAQRRKLALQAQLMKVIRTRREAERLQQRRRFCRHR